MKTSIFHNQSTFAEYNLACDAQSGLAGPLDPVLAALVGFNTFEEVGEGIHRIYQVYKDSEFLLIFLNSVFYRQMLNVDDKECLDLSDLQVFFVKITFSKSDHHDNNCSSLIFGWYI